MYELSNISIVIVSFNSEEKLFELGEVRPPFIADLFTAIMDKTKRGIKS